MILHTSSQ